jgi:polysaccharide export outer membrane protein
MGLIFAPFACFVVSHRPKVLVSERSLHYATVAPPGEYVLSRDIDVLQAIALAGGLTPFAKKKKIKILRKEKGNQRVFHFNYRELENGQRVGQNIILMQKDTIIVL